MLDERTTDIMMMMIMRYTDAIDICKHTHKQLLYNKKPFICQCDSVKYETKTIIINGLNYDS